MQKIFLLAVLALSILAGNVQAEIRELPPLEEKRVETLIVLKMDQIKPPQGEGRLRYLTTAYWQTKKVGAGIDTTTDPDKDYLSFNPYLTYKVGQSPIQLVGGYWTDSAGSDFTHVGVWYADKWGRAIAFLEIRDYVAINGKAKDYLDNFLEVVYPVLNKVDVGVNITYDRQWSGKDRNYVQAGPVAYYRIGKSTTVFVRPTRETGNVDMIRFGVKISF